MAQELALVSMPVPMVPMPMPMPMPMPILRSGTIGTYTETGNARYVVRYGVSLWVLLYLLSRYFRVYLLSLEFFPQPSKWKARIGR